MYFPCMTENPDTNGDPHTQHGSAPRALTVEGIIAVHAGVIAESDGADARILSEANLHQLVFCANTMTDVYSRAAYVFFSLCAYPPFREGNEQTARRVTEHLLRKSGVHVALDERWIAPLVAGIAAITVEPEDIERVIREHAQ
jgi:prophage maintenance system killer protein